MTASTRLPLSCSRSSSWKHASLHILKLFTVVYVFPFLLTYVPSYVSLAGRRVGKNDPDLPLAAMLSIRYQKDPTWLNYHYFLIPTLLQDRSFRVAWSVNSLVPPPDLVSALQIWDTTQVTTTSLKVLPDIKLTQTDDTEWCLYLPSSLLEDDGSPEKICRTGSLQGDYNHASARGTFLSAHVSIVVSNPNNAQTPKVTSTGALTAGGFRKNPNRHKPSLVDRMGAILPLTTFGLLAGLQVFLFVVYWNASVSASAVGKSFADMWQGGEVWRALSGSTAHFDLWHIGLNLSAFYQLSHALQHSMPPIMYLGLNLSFMAWVTVFWILWQYGRHRMQSDPAASLNSTPTVGYSGVLFALSTIVTLQRHESCPIPFMESMCFTTHRVGGLAFSLAPLVQLGLVQVVLPRVSFAGHLAGIVVGFAYTTGILPVSAYPCIIWPVCHLVYLMGIAPYLSSNNSSDGGRRLGDARSWFASAVAPPEIRISLAVLVFSSFALGLTNPLVWSYSLTAILWSQSTTSSESTATILKRAFCVYAIVLLMTHAATVGAWALLPRTWLKTSSLTAVVLQALTLWGGLLRTLDDVLNTEGIFRHALGWAILQPLTHLQSIWRTLRRVEMGQSVVSFPGEGRRLRQVEAELV